MNNYTSKRKKFLILLTTAAVLTTGCSAAKPVPIVSINDKNLYMEDFLYDIYEVESEGNKQESYYQEDLGYSYWDYECNGTSMRELAKNSVIASVVMYEILSDQALKKGMTLTTLEKSEINNKISELFTESSQDNLDRIGLTKEVLLKTLNKKSLGDMYRKELSKDFLIDEDAIRSSLDPKDYREYKTECLFIPIVKSENQTLVPLSQEEKEAAYDTIVDALNKLNDGEGFDSILNEDSKLDYLTRDFIQKDLICEKEYQEAAMLLSKNEFSPVVTTDYGYYIIHMLDDNSTDKYEEAVEQAVAAEEDTQFTIVYNKLKEQYDITINFDYWDTLTIGSITTPKN